MLDRREDICYYIEAVRKGSITMQNSLKVL